MARGNPTRGGGGLLELDFQLPVFALHTFQKFLQLGSQFTD